MKSCSDFRDQWLEHALDQAACARLVEDSAHLAGCDSCAEWLRSRRGQVQSLRSLPRVEPPAALADPVRETGLRPALESALTTQPRLEVPAELDALVARVFEEPTSVPTEKQLDPERARKSVRALDYSVVPSVLERLVDEELSNPGATTVARFVRDLEPQRAPDRLRVLVQRHLRRPLVVRLASVAAAAAVVLAVWIAFPTASGEHRRALRVVHVEELERFDPVAIEHVKVLGGRVDQALLLEEGR